MPTQTQAATASFLSRFVSEHADKHPVRDFEDTYERNRQDVESADAESGMKELAQKLLKCARDAYFMEQICAWKIYHLARSLVHAIDSQNPVSLANDTRALVEYLASFCYVHHALGHMRSGLEGQNSPEKIKTLLDKTDLTLRRAYYGKSPNKNVPKAEQSPHINDCLAELKKRVRDITDVYNYLCEYAHPNHGSNTLVARGEIGRGELEPDAELLANVLDRMCGYCVCAIKAVQQLELEGAITCIFVSDLSKRAVKRGATVRP